MEDDHDGSPHRKTTTQEDNLTRRSLQSRDDLIGRQPYRRATTHDEENLKGIFIARKVKSQEDNLTKRQL